VCGLERWEVGRVGTLGDGEKGILKIFRLFVYLIEKWIDGNIRLN
jgi:hypothetical protein